MKKWLPAALIVMTATIVFAATRVDYKDYETCHSEWMIYRPVPVKPAGSVAEAKADSPVVATIKP